MTITYWEQRCGQCRKTPRDAANFDWDCDLCKGTGKVERCQDCHAAISPKDDGCFYCDVMGERPGLDDTKKASV